jgi:endogenous inhibitor of DNA gyrase (YacG/DUF329 family)
MLRRSTHYDCPKCGYNLSCYAQNSCQRCALVFDQTTNTPVCSTTKRLVDVDTKTDGDFAVNTAMNDATKRFINVDTKTDRDNRDISVNTATKRPLLEKPDGDISFNTVKKRHIVEDDMKITKTFRLKHSSSA